MKKFTPSAVGLSFGLANQRIEKLENSLTEAQRFYVKTQYYLMKEGKLTEYAAKILLENNSEAYDKCRASGLDAKETAEILIQATFKTA